MAIPLDFSSSKQTLARFNQFLSYDLLDQMRSDRDADLMRVQDKLMRERQVEAGRIDIGVAEYKSALTDKEAYTKAMLDYAKLPGADYRVSMARLATDPNLPPQYHEAAIQAAKDYAAEIIPLAQAAYNASRGTGTWEDYAAMLKGGGFRGMEEAYKESGTNIRASRQAGIEEQKLGIEREKLTDVGAGRTQAAAEKMTDRYIKWIDDTVSYLVGEGVQGQAMTGEMPIYLESKSRDPLSSQDRGFALTHLQNIKAQILRQGYETLTDGQLSFVSKVYNTPAVQGFVTEKLKEPPAAGKRPPRPGAAGAPAPVAGGTQGGLNPYTGNTAADEAGVRASRREGLFNHYVEFDIQNLFGGVRSAENKAKAEARANEFISLYHKDLEPSATIK